MVRQQARQQRQTARQSNNDRQEQGSKEANRQGRKARQEHKAAKQGSSSTQERIRVQCESDAGGKVLRIDHALNVDTGHHRFMEPSRKKQHKPRDAHAKRIVML